ncbi:hypothetical protein KBC55_02900 [Patescibacteria group bacterium]|nr:hypothetical protein [Patescibacteria group bacterium]
MSFLYVNGQDIGRLVLGLCAVSDTGGWSFSHTPEVISVSPEAYLSAIDAYIVAQGTALASLQGFVLVAGPGSATALRAAHALVNALSFARSIPVYSIEKEATLADAGVFTQSEVRSTRVAVPVYAHEARITQGTKDALRRNI